MDYYGESQRRELYTIVDYKHSSIAAASLEAKSFKEGYSEGWNDALVKFEDEFMKVVKVCFDKYSQDKSNICKPDASAMISLFNAVKHKLEKRGKNNYVLY